jgi:hypothetical protein
MTKERYWVIGGEYSNTAFKTLKAGAHPDVAGPFDTREEARVAWKRLSEEHRSCATARYSIASEQLVLPN